MPPTNNPAGRLYAILDEVRAKPRKKSIRNVWAETFGLEPSATADILFLIGKMIELARDAKQSINGLDNIDHEIYIKPFHNIEKAFSFANIEDHWDNISRHLDEATMVGLSFCADVLSRTSGEQIIDQETLNDLMEQVENLTHEIMDSEIPPDLKAVLIDNLEEIRRAILEYRIRGVDGLKRALEGSLGAVIRHRPQIVKQKGKKPVARFLEILSKLDQVVAFSLRMKQLFGPVLGEILQIESHGEQADS